MTDIVWEDPPAGTRGRKGWRPAVVEELKQNPGKWALVERNAWLGPTALWRGYGCETRTRTSGHPRNKGDIYARWPA